MNYSRVAIAAFLLCAAQAAAQTYNPPAATKPDRMESLDRQARIFGRLLQKKLNISPSMAFFGANASKPAVEVQDPTKLNPDAYEWIRSFHFTQESANAARVIHCQVKTAAIPSIGAMVWVECDIPTTAVGGKAEPGAQTNASNDWEEAQREIEGTAARNKATSANTAGPSGPTKLIMDPDAEASVIKAIDEIATQHAVRLEALEAGEAIVVVLRLKPRGGLQEYLEYGSGGSGSSFVPNLNQRTADPRINYSSQWLATSVPEVVVVLRFPRVQEGTSASLMQHVTRYQVR